MTALVKLQPELKKRQLSLKQRKLPNFSVGERGEQIALAYLQRCGYLQVAQNVLSRKAEIDLIVIDPQRDELVFVEVKTRCSAYAGHPSQAVNHHKIHLMQSAGKYLVRVLGWKNDYRFDIISILPGTIEHHQNVTWLR